MRLNSGSESPSLTWDVAATLFTESYTLPAGASISPLTTLTLDVGAITNVLASLGAEFEADANVFATVSPRRSLPTKWKVSMITPLKSASNPKHHTDPGMSEAATLAVQPGFDGAPKRRREGQAQARGMLTVKCDHAGRTAIARNHSQAI